MNETTAHPEPGTPAGCWTPRRMRLIVRDPSMAGRFGGGLRRRDRDGREADRVRGGGRCDVEGADSRLSGCNTPECVTPATVVMPYPLPRAGRHARVEATTTRLVNSGVVPSVLDGDPVPAAHPGFDSLARATRSTELVPTCTRSVPGPYPVGCGTGYSLNLFLMLTLVPIPGVCTRCTRLIGPSPTPRRGGASTPYPFSCFFLFPLKKRESTGYTGYRLPKVRRKILYGLSSDSATCTRLVTRSGVRTGYTGYNPTDTDRIRSDPAGDRARRCMRTEHLAPRHVVRVPAVRRRPDVRRHRQRGGPGSLPPPVTRRPELHRHGQEGGPDLGRN